MSQRTKLFLSVIAIVVMLGFQGYMAYKAAPAVAEQIVAYNQTHPMSWVDFGLGVVTTFFTMTMIFVGISLRESIRFEREFEKNGPGGSDGGPSGGTKRVRLPMSRKIISIDEFRKTPPVNDRLHRGFAEATT